MVISEPMLVNLVTLIDKNKTLWKQAQILCRCCEVISNRLQYSKLSYPVFAYAFRRFFWSVFRQFGHHGKTCSHICHIQDATVSSLGRLGLYYYSLVEVSYRLRPVSFTGLELLCFFCSEFLSPSLLFIALPVLMSSACLHGIVFRPALRPAFPPCYCTPLVSLPFLPFVLHPIHLPLLLFVVS